MTACSLSIEGMHHITSLFDNAISLLCPKCTVLLTAMGEQQERDMDSEYNTKVNSGDTDTR